MTPEQLRWIADELDRLEQERIALLVGLGDELHASGYESIEPDSASVQVADEGAGGEAERSLPPPDAPIEQVTPDGSPGSGSARRRQPTISPASPGTDFDPLGPAAALLACTECVRTFARPQGLALHAKSHRRAAALTNGAPPSGNGLPVAVGVPGGGHSVPRLRASVPRQPRLPGARQGPPGNGQAAGRRRGTAHGWRARGVSA